MIISRCSDFHKSKLFGIHHLSLRSTFAKARGKDIVIGPRGEIMIKRIPNNLEFNDYFGLLLLKVDFLLLLSDGKRMVQKKTGSTRVQVSAEVFPARYSSGEYFRKFSIMPEHDTV